MAKQTNQAAINNPTTLAINKSVQVMETAKKNLTELFNQVDGAVSHLEDVAHAVEVKKADLAELEVTYKNKLRESKADLEISIRENEEAVIVSLLNRTGRVDITRSDFIALQSKVKEANDDKLKAVSDAVDAVEAKHLAQVNNLSSEHRVQIAELNAKNNQLTNEKSFLIDQVAELKEQITAEREARIQVAQAESQKTNTFNISKG